MKKYLKPEISEIKFDTFDIITASGELFSKGNNIQSAGHVEYNELWSQYLSD